MAQSAEYPDLKWMPPRAWGSGRDGKAVRLIVIHYTAGAERNTSAEDGARYDQDRRDGTSTHYFVDSDSVVQCVRTSDRGNAARTKGNRLGVQYELCGTVQTRAQWLDAASLPTLRNAAKQVARDCRKYGIPVRRLSVAETRRSWTEFPNGPRGIVGHVDCTNAFPEDGGDHTDPGAQFPWDVFLGLVQDELEDDMPTAEEIATATAKKVWEYRMASGYASAPAVQAQTTAKAATLAEVQTRGLAASIALLRAEVAGLAGRDFTDEGAIVAGVLAGLDPQAIAAAIPRELVQQVVDELVARLQA